MSHLEGWGKTPLELALWSQVGVRQFSLCWEFKGAIGSHGYGVARGRLAHRVAWECSTGEIPDGLWVLHRCDNRICCNPRHLFLGTPKDNVDDMDAKGRRVNHPNPGEKNGFAKLIAPQVLEIRRRVKAGEHIPDLAAEFGITRNNIYYIRDRKAWKHLPETGE